MPNDAIHVPLQGINSTYRQDIDPRHLPQRVSQSKPKFMGTEKPEVSDKGVIFALLTYKTIPNSEVQRRQLTEGKVRGSHARTALMFGKNARRTPLDR